VSITLILSNGRKLVVQGTNDRDVAVYRAKKLGFKVA
jgi:uncharacterized protein YlzI (FlbEa/FlbD family)